MKKILPEYSFTEEQLNKIVILAKQTDMTENAVRILYARGIDTEEKIKRFINPSERNFLSPFLMKGMKEAVEMITEARDMGKTVAVFGDYDADGVCASTIMYYALKQFGIEPNIYIPERIEGYGLSIEAVEKIFEECQPELFITVDCGISCAKEAQYIYELGADVIITDHHELPEILPDCVIVNPKLKDEYPYDNLCGAGVAFKLACALLGTEAYKLLDFAALATVADSVPLTGENRDIVFEGLKRFNNNPRFCFSSLIGKAGVDITSQSLGYTIAPRINAAGRMGDAHAAFELFTSKDNTEILSLAEKLTCYNFERQKYCDELYQSAKEQLRKKGAFGYVIMLSEEGWNAGFIGIVAARIAEEYNRPTILFVHRGDSLKGSARSIDGVNIYNALKSCSEYITEFGGHSQAAGVNIKAENFSILEQALNEEIAKTHTAEDFEQRIYVAEEITKPFSERFAEELVKLEPYGVGHKKPLFSVAAKECNVKQIKPLSPHLSIKNPNIELMYFSGLKNLRLIESDVEKKFVFEVNVSEFRGKEYIKGFVRDVIYDGRSGKKAIDGIFLNTMNGLNEQKVETIIEYRSVEEIKRIIDEKEKECAYGLCMIASDRNTLLTFDKKEGIELFYPSSHNLSNMVIISPSADADLSEYRDFVFLDMPPDLNYAFLKGKKAYINKDICGYKQLLTLDAERETLLSVYGVIRKLAGEMSGVGKEEISEKAREFRIDKNEFMFALGVFEQLGLISFENGFTVYRGVKADLNDSVVYKKISELQKKGF